MEPFLSSSSSSSSSLFNLVEAEELDPTAATIEVDVVGVDAGGHVIGDSDDEEVTIFADEYGDVDNRMERDDHGDDENDESVDFVGDGSNGGGANDSGFDEEDIIYSDEKSEYEWDAENMRLLFAEMKDTLMPDVTFNYTQRVTKVTNFLVCCAQLKCDFTPYQILASVCSKLQIPCQMDIHINAILDGEVTGDIIKEGLFFFFFREFAMCQVCGTRMGRVNHPSDLAIAA